MPIGKSLLECQEMADHFRAYEWMHAHLDHPFNVELIKHINKLVTLHTLTYKAPNATPGEFTTVDMAAGDTIFGEHEKLIAQVPRLVESTAKAIHSGKCIQWSLLPASTVSTNTCIRFETVMGAPGRLLSNFILLHFGLPELIIRKEDREEYIGALKQIRKENTDEYLIRFFLKAAIWQMKHEIEQKHKANRTLFIF